MRILDIDVASANGDVWVGEWCPKGEDISKVIQRHVADVAERRPADGVVIIVRVPA